jgi:D-lactate dehydrogenase (cytochrome)
MRVPRRNQETAVDDARKPVSDDVLQRIAVVVGPKGIIIDPADMAPFLIDQRKAYEGRTPMIVRPASTEETASIVRLCHESGTAIVPQGGNTGLCGAATPHRDGSEILLSMTRMNRVRAIDPLNYTITVEAGVILLDVQKHAAEADRLFPLSLGGEGTARIGGNLSTNAGGTGVLRYGNARELVLGLEVVLPDGRIWDGLSALRKDNTGYDLKQLFVGAEGTLGVITAAVLKLFPKPKDIQTAFCAVRDPAAALAILGRARAASDDRVTAFEWMARMGVGFAVKHIPGVRDPLSKVYDEYLLIELTSGHDDGSLRAVLERILADAMERGEVLDAAIAESRGQAKDFWKIRETIPEAQTYEGASAKHDVSVPVSSVPEFLRRANAAVSAAVPGLRICAFGHAGDGNLHYNLSRPDPGSDDAFKARYGELNRIVHDIAADLRGSISAEHGIGQLKRGELLRYKNPVAIELMRALKATLDPRGIMNPGKVL